MERMKTAFGLFACAFIACCLTAASLPAASEQPGFLEKQPWFNPAAELFTNPASIQDPELFSPGSLQALWQGVRGERIGPDCPPLLCATHPLGLALVAGGLAREAVREEENLRLAEILMGLGRDHGNLYGAGSLSDRGGSLYERVGTLCGSLALRVAWREGGGRRQIVLYCDAIDPAIPLYSDLTGEPSLIAACLAQCPCSGVPGPVPEGEAPRPGGDGPTKAPGATVSPTLYLPGGMFEAVTPYVRPVTPVPEGWREIEPFEGIVTLPPDWRRVVPDPTLL